MSLRAYLLRSRKQTVGSIRIRSGCLRRQRIVAPLREHFSNPDLILDEVERDIRAASRNNRSTAHLEFLKNELEVSV